MKRILIGLLAAIIAVAGIEPVALMAADSERAKENEMPVSVEWGSRTEQIPEPQSGIDTLNEVQQNGINARAASERASTIASGTCGSNANWTLDSNYILTISGTGAMTDYDSPYDQPWYDYASQVRAIIVEDGITRIGNLAFAWFCNVTSLSTPDSVTEVGDAAFLEFSNADTTIYIPEQWEYIGYQAFSYNYYLDYSVDENNQYYCSVNGHLLDEEKTILWQAGNLCEEEDIDLPSTVEIIANTAMSSGTYTTVDLKNIGLLATGALRECADLHTVNLGNNLEWIYPEAFKGCSSLESIIIPKGCTGMHNQAFAECTSLSSITFNGNAPAFYDGDQFLNVTATASYYLTSGGWTDDVKQNYGGNITWKGMKSSNTITASNVSKVVSSSKRTVELGAKAKGSAKLSYKSNNDNIAVNSKGVITIKKNYIGKATITITAAATNKYKKTTKKITVTVKPVKATINSLKLKNSKILMKNKKNIGNVKYQIQYATNSSFENASNIYTKYVSDGYYIVKPKKGKTYYVRVRGYKKVNDVTYRGKWSEVKKIKISK